MQGLQKITYSFRYVCMLLALAATSVYAEEVAVADAKEPAVSLQDSTHIFRQLDFSLADGRFSAFSAPVNFDLKLSKLLGDATPRSLNGVDARMNIALPLPGLWEPEEVILELSGVASKSLIKSS